MRHLICLLVGTIGLSACELDEPGQHNDDKFPIDPHDLMPMYTWDDGQVAAGTVTGKDAALE